MIIVSFLILVFGSIKLYYFKSQCHPKCRYVCGTETQCCDASMIHQHHKTVQRTPGPLGPFYIFITN